MKKEGRFHLRLRKELEQKMKSYAERHETTITALVEQHFLELLREEERMLALQDIEVGEQI